MVSRTREWLSPSIKCLLHTFFPVYGFKLDFELRVREREMHWFTSASLDWALYTPVRRSNESLE